MSNGLRITGWSVTPCLQRLADRVAVDSRHDANYEFSCIGRNRFAFAWSSETAGLDDTRVVNGLLKSLGYEPLAMSAPCTSGGPRAIIFQRKEA
jgi:hypothetical protein